MALDCAYHFKTRETFLKQCFERLDPRGGRIALADMCFEPVSSDGRVRCFIARIVSRILAVPSANLITRSEYSLQLASIGFVEIEVEDISEHVFPGFIIFLKSRGALWGVFASVVGFWRRSGGTFVLVSATRYSVAS
jgi:hypothetical protein